MLNESWLNTVMVSRINAFRSRYSLPTSLTWGLCLLVQTQGTLFLSMLRLPSSSTPLSFVICITQKHFLPVTPSGPGRMGGEQMIFIILSVQSSSAACLQELVHSPQLNPLGTLHFSMDLPKVVFPWKPSGQPDRYSDR